jgi:hypothetical protein
MLDIPKFLLIVMAKFFGGDPEMSYLDASSAEVWL